jgi:hypothetical protein
MLGSIASGSWDNYHMVGKHMGVATLILSNFIKW